MIAAFLIAAASIPTAIDAERAFAADAQRIGQWTAFRKYADQDAVMFTPQPVWAQEFLKDRKDPPQSVKWWPADSFVSCDGRTAVNTGPWVSASGKSQGYFTTVWQREGRNWRWVYDGGASTKEAPGEALNPRVHLAACDGRAPGAPISKSPPPTAKQAHTAPENSGRGQSADKTLGWDWTVEKNGARHFRVFAWNGYRYAQVLYNDIPAE